MYNGLETFNCPDYSSDGSEIVFVTNRDNNNEIYVMDADGTDLKNLTNHPSNDRNPRFTPDGKIIFSSNRVNGNYKLFIMNSDGSKQNRISKNLNGNDRQADTAKIR